MNSCRTLSGGGWDENAELSERDKEALDEALAEYERAPDQGSPWEEVEARIRAQLRK